MKLERLHEYVTAAVVLLIGVVFASVCGLMTGEGQFKLLGAIFAGLFVVTLCIAMKTRIWLLIPLAWPLASSIPASGFPFGVRDIAVMVAFAYFVILIVLKAIRTKTKFDLIDVMVIANLVYLATVFLRNPVGVRVFETDMVGGKPYFDVMIGFLAYWVLCRAPVDLEMVYRLPLFLLPANIISGLGSVLVKLVPSSGFVMAQIYADFATPETLVGPVAPENVIDRQFGLSGIGLTGMQVLTSYFRPITLLQPIYFGRFLSAVCFMLALLFSGFRSALISVVVYIVFSTYFRKHTKDLVLLAVFAAIGISILVLGNGTVFKLPAAIQRSICFLPGNWDSEIVADAQGSLDWRRDMWRMVWTEDRWIRNKALGDGFGFRRDELAIMEAMNEGGPGFLGGAQQELFMINGVFHNGPLSTIRYVGEVGMVLYYILIVLLAFRSVRMIRASRGTPLFPSALFIGMPVLSYALSYPFGVGQFQLDAPQFLFSAGLLKLAARAIETIPKDSLKSAGVVPDEPRLSTRLQSPAVAGAAGLFR